MAKKKNQEFKNYVKIQIDNFDVHRMMGPMMRMPPPPEMLRMPMGPGMRMPPPEMMMRMPMGPGPGMRMPPPEMLARMLPPELLQRMPPPGDMIPPEMLMRPPPPEVAKMMQMMPAELLQPLEPMNGVDPEKEAKKKAIRLLQAGEFPFEKGSEIKDRREIYIRESFQTFHNFRMNIKQVQRDFDSIKICQKLSKIDQNCPKVRKTKYVKN